MTRFGKFEGLKGRSYQEAALVDLQEALGWNSYYIDEWPVQKAGLAPDQIQITGSMQLDASKCGLRFLDVYVVQPYPPELKLKITATYITADKLPRLEQSPVETEGEHKVKTRDYPN